MPSPSSTELPRSPLGVALEPTDGSVPLWWVDHFESRRQTEHQSTGTAPGIAVREESTQAGLLGVIQALARFMSVPGLAAALVLWPAANIPQGLDVPAVWGLFFKYLAFAVSWNLSRGPGQGRAAAGPGLGKRVAEWTFFAALGLCHWPPMLRFASMRLAAPGTGVTVYDIAGNAGILVAVLLSLWAARSSAKSI
ncbi:MAG: hypothetical protein WDW36_005475 [Sanguina aurantia]